jgi:hypothetical protein
MVCMAPSDAGRSVWPGGPRPVWYQEKRVIEKEKGRSGLAGWCMGKVVSVLKMRGRMRIVGSKKEERSIKVFRRRPQQHPR